MSATASSLRQRIDAVWAALVPGSKAHGPDEFLHLPTARRVTECIARLLGAHAASPR